MKPKYFYLLTVCMLLICSEIFSQIPSYVPTNGLVGYWPFTGNANDVSSNNLNGTVTGATLTTDRNNVSNTAYSFTYQGWNPGTQLTEIYIAYSPLLNNNQLAVSCWVYPTAYGYPGSGASIVKRFQYGYSNPNGETWELMFAPDHTLIGIISEASASQTQNTATVMADSLQLNVWSHVVMNYDGSTLTLTVNGVLAGSTSTSLALNTNGNSGVSIGVSDQANGWWDPFEGKIDDIGIWSRALTQQETVGLSSGSTCSYTDTTHVVIYDTTHVAVYDTTHAIIYDTTHISVNDTTHITVYDTATTHLSVTDTLIINVNLTGVAPPNNINSVTVYPNPAHDHLVIDNGNLISMTGYSIKITNALGQIVFNQIANQQQFYIDLNTFTGTGTYILYVLDASQIVKSTKEIVLQ